MKARKMLFAASQISFFIILSFLTTKIVPFYIHMAYSMIMTYLFRNGLYLEETFSNAFDSGSLSGTTDSSSTTIIVGASYTNSVGQENPAEEPPLLSHFGGQFPGLDELELELYARIRLLEARQIEQLPPQLNEGEYEELVKNNLNQARDPDHYLTSLNDEFFDLTVLELKADLQDQLFNLFLNEPEARFLSLLRSSTFKEQDIRPEALEFIKLRLERFGQTDPYPRDQVNKTLMQEYLRFWLSELRQQGPNSPFYNSFIIYFRNGG